MSSLPPILLIDDAADDRELVSLVLAGAFGEVAIEEVTDAVMLARAVSLRRFGLVLTEHELPWIRSGDLLRLVRDLVPECPVIVVTGRPIERVAAEIIHLGPDGLVPKTSTGLAGLPQVIRAALLHARRRALTAGAEGSARRLLDALPLGVFVASADGTLLDVNPAFARLLGFDLPEQCVRRPLESLFASGAEHEAMRERLGREPGPPFVVRFKRADGAAVPARLTVWQSTGDGIAPGSLQGAVESMAPEASERGAAAPPPAGLDEMAYVVSHDLRQPLTQIVRYLDLLDREAGASLAPDPRSSLDQARSSARRLEEMVEALLRLARVESRGQTLAPVQLGRVLERVLERLRSELQELDARVEVATLPEVLADASQIEQLFENLIGNALKFRGGAAPRLEIDAIDDGPDWHLRFRDWGIGLDPKDAERIFRLFQRLHTESEIPGNGIGLALCRRIVARHGGRIWVESRPQQGATFHVTLPKPPGAGGKTDASEERER